MTDDAYLFLLDDTTTPLGVPPASVGDLACLETPAVRAWLDAYGVTVTSPQLRLVPPEETAAIPDGAERLPVPLSDEELSRLRHHNAPEARADIENQLRAYREYADGRDALLGRAVAAGVPLERIVELTGEDPATVAAVAR
ncbi:DUF6003 family protein [Streptomyces roseolilacinus]|uniref:Uncharacterized protein n=1 Tax=Streptomyces roseolilacinus TaxID=66904 RepID=A0A918EK90_9ACTN|nr:DUF6003 family protein [Streptomyces roseolilacinus]GGP96137.1 hypothetical protein GCM10010249_12840 [Streptomyces roseolilacinus]